MTLSQKRRIEKIEKALKINKGKTTLFPVGQGRFIEVPSNLSFIDMIALCGGMGKNKKLNEN